MYADLPDMYSSDEDDGMADTRSRFALPSQYQRAKLQEENDEEDLFESDSEGELSSRSEQSESREIESESEIHSVAGEKIPEAGSVAMFQRLSAMANEFMITVQQFKEQASDSKDGNGDSLYCSAANSKSILSISLHCGKRVRWFRRRRRTRK